MDLSNGEQQWLSQVIENCGDVVGRHHIVTSLNVVASHKIYRLSSEKGHFVIKRFVFDPKLPCKRSQTFALQEKLAARGIAPSPVWMNQSLNTWIEEYYPPKSLFDNDRDVDPISLIASSLAEVHSLDIDHHRLNLTRLWDDYLDVLGRDQYPQYVKAVEHLKSAHDKFYQKHDRWTLCHNDLSLNHILSSKPIVLVDWEYAATGCRYFDIASSMLINEMSQFEQSSLCRQYAEKTGQSESMIKQCIERVKPFADLTYELWDASKSALPLS